MELTIEERGVRVVRPSGDTLRLPTWDGVLLTGQPGTFWLLAFRHNRPDTADP